AAFFDKKLFFSPLFARAPRPLCRVQGPSQGDGPCLCEEQVCRRGELELLATLVHCVCS
uniref:Uncharacterized protein n=1 Tax=Oryza brachyantha TaxID=4533 RepID=J3M5Y2_ORYBR